MGGERLRVNPGQEPQPPVRQLQPRRLPKIFAVALGATILALPQLLGAPGPILGALVRGAGFPGFGLFFLLSSLLPLLLALPASAVVRAIARPESEEDAESAGLYIALLFPILAYLAIWIHDDPTIEGFGISLLFPFLVGAAGAALIIRALAAPT